MSPAQGARTRRRSAPPTSDQVVRRFTIAVRRTIEARTILHGGETVIVAVSGGADSLALLHAMHRLRRALGLRITVAHLDHAMRPGSVEDATFVVAEAERLGLPVTMGVAEPGRVKGESLEETLRIRRDRFLGQTATAVGAARVLTGHTMNDQAETVLINLLTGAGRRGLGAMPPARWRVGRPLIDRTRAETLAMCAALGLEPRHDETNDDPSFLRNRVRLEILPGMLDVNPRMIEHLAHLADICRDEDYFLDRTAAHAAQPDPERNAISIETLRAMPAALSRRAVRLLARNQNLGISSEQVEQILHLVGSEKDGRIDLDGPLSAWRAHDLLSVSREPVCR